MGYTRACDVPAPHRETVTDYTSEAISNKRSLVSNDYSANRRQRIFRIFTSRHTRDQYIKIPFYNFDNNVNEVVHYIFEETSPEKTQKTRELEPKTQQTN
ncbi:hypothetical protein CDAR_369961 [Caerostris darwini]|uniref:Uncharacterized protein n=1 Tax=Caerostris darwini TaxID=1538125 RepID=A0AAV4Q050_9ARAC|nr:hypothetical protein CDAR_369961 [Caerostris darwini]